MPIRAQSLCASAGCTVRVDKAGLCPACKASRQKEVDAKRGSSTERGYGGRWRKARAGFLRDHPLCVRCEVEGRVTVATVVDHKVPHKGDWKLFWDRSNWQSLCKPHHDTKTAKEDGGFGRGEGVSNL